MRYFIKSIVLITLIVNFSCNPERKNTVDVDASTRLSGKVTIFHAGSLTVPFKILADSFQKIHPGVNIQLEAAGSVACARKITDLGRDCDIMASADYTIINKMLIPEYTDWNIKFAGNEMVIGYHKGSRYADQINKDNWYNILLKDDVKYGRSDPNSDPCGYRSILSMKLLEKFYNKVGITERFLAKDERFIRPKETDLLALLETNTIDYFFIYRSVACQHDHPYIELPDTINLSNANLGEVYNTAEVNIAGKKPGQYLTQRGEPMVYGITILKNAPNYNAAVSFLDFLLSEKGTKIMERNCQPSLVPSQSSSYENIPEVLKKYALETE